MAVFSALTAALTSEGLGPESMYEGRTLRALARVAAPCRNRSISDCTDAASASIVPPSASIVPWSAATVPLSASTSRPITCTRTFKMVQRTVSYRATGVNSGIGG